MNKTKIEWCDYTWNPVTGCMNNCEYCYARKIATRFDKGCNFLSPRLNVAPKTNNGKEISFPYGFAPTFYPDRLKEPKGKKKTLTIFVCSMSDLFGDWVPDEWIRQVFAACDAAPQHRYIFLTKNPERYRKIFPNLSPNFYLGQTITSPYRTFIYSHRNLNTFISYEPIQEPITYAGQIPDSIKWIIAGAETGNRKGKVTVQKEWLDKLVDICKEKKIPLFMKNSLSKIWDRPLIQEYLWEVGDA